MLCVCSVLLSLTHLVLVCSYTCLRFVEFGDIYMRVFFELWLTVRREIRIASESSASLGISVSFNDSIIGIIELRPYDAHCLLAQLNTHANLQFLVRLRFGCDT